MVNAETIKEPSLKIVGLMSGTSLDGLDICYVDFNYKDGKWNYEIIKAVSRNYPEDIKMKLSIAQNMSALEYAQFNSDYGLHLGSHVKEFITENGFKPDYIASHGHTIFHQPERRFTSQIGSGAGIAAVSGVNTICDFRSTDVAYWGQGAPLVSIGDKVLYSDYDYCLNLGGISNVSFDNAYNKRMAFDICPVNYVLNHYTRSIGLDYDKDGEMAREGSLNFDLLNALNNLDYYSMTGPKTLGREWIEKEIIPLTDSYIIRLEDKLHTFCEHIAMQIGRNLKRGRCLLTGGGAFNKYLVERIRINAPKCEFIIPEETTIVFKEALLFAFLGALFVNDQPNCLASVTGAVTNAIGGALYKASKQ